MADIQGLDASSPLEPPNTDGSSPVDIHAKRKGRQRLLRGIQRISSSPSLAQLGRSRSLSAPYGSRNSFSCASLATAASRTGSGSSGSPLGSPGACPSGSSSIPMTPTTESSMSSVSSGMDGYLAIRKIDNGITNCLSPTSPTSPLPPDIMSTKLEGPPTKTQTTPRPARERPFSFWGDMPHELKIHIFSCFQPRELVRVSRVSKDFFETCFDGQLWTSFDASDFYQDIPAESLASIIVSAGPFIKDLNLRGCMQVEHYKRAEVVVKACKNLINATLEGCRNFQRNALHSLLRSNEKLANLNLTGLMAVTNMSCKIIAESCPQLEMFNVSWCRQMDARGIRTVVEGCERLKDLRAGEIMGFDNVDVAVALFRTNKLERLVLSGCTDLSDQALKAMIHGIDPEIDILTDLPVVPHRKLRHLDLSCCSGLTSHGVKALGHNVPDLEGLQLSGCMALTDEALEPILASTPRLTHLELEDLSELTNGLLSEHLAKAPCAPRLEHLSLSYCENIGDAGMLPVMKSCIQLRSIDLDNTRISDLVLAEAAVMVGKRSTRTEHSKTRPAIGLHMVVYDCQNVTWTGIREVLFRNTQVKHTGGRDSKLTYPTEMIGLKCFYGFQMTVDEHTKRVLRGDLSAASRLERKWADYMQANEEAGTTGAGNRRRRRRAREAQQLHADEEEGGGAGNGRRRARTVAACAVM